MQVPASLDFGRDNGLPVISSHVFEYGVAKGHCALDDAADWMEGRSAGCDSLFELADIADVALVNADLDTLSSEIRHKGGGV